MKKPYLSRATLTSTLFLPFTAQQGRILFHSAMWHSVDAPLHTIVMDDGYMCEWHKCVVILMEWCNVVDRCHAQQLCYAVIFALCNFFANSTCDTMHFVTVLYYSVVLHVCTHFKPLITSKYCDCLKMETLGPHLGNFLIDNTKSPSLRIGMQHWPIPTTNTHWLQKNSIIPI